MRLLARDGEIAIGGTPWLPQGEFKSVGFNSLTAKCLCRRHNSALHFLDDAALSFFSSLRSALESDGAPLRYIVSGHDLERWLLKTLKAMATSGNLARKRQTLSGCFSKNVDVPTLLESPDAWPSGSGLYCVMVPGQRAFNHNRFQLAPLTNDDTGSIGGLWANIIGLSFILMLEPLDLEQNPQLRGAIHRPGGIKIDYPAKRNTILLSWDDGGRQRDAVSLRFEKTVAADRVSAAPPRPHPL